MMNPDLLVGMEWHGFATMPLLEASVAHKRANRLWVDGNDGIGILLNPGPFLDEPYDDLLYNTDMGIKLIPMEEFEHMDLLAGGNHEWGNYQSPSRRHGLNPLRRDKRYGVMKAHGNQVLDAEAVWLEHWEVKGDLRCRRRLFFPPEVAAAIGAPPLVLLQYKRFPFCHPAAHRLELLLVIEAIEAGEAAAAAAAAAGGVNAVAAGAVDAAAAGAEGGAVVADAADAGDAVAADGAAGGGGDAVAVEGAADAVEAAAAAEGLRAVVWLRTRRMQATPRRRTEQLVVAATPRRRPAARTDGPKITCRR